MVTPSSQIHPGVLLTRSYREGTDSLFFRYLIMCVLATNKVSPRRFLFLFPFNGSLIELLLNDLEVKHLDEVDQKKSSTCCQGSRLSSEQNNHVARSQPCSGHYLDRSVHD